MPELPDVTIYIEALEARVVGHRLERILLKNPFLLRTAEPPLHICEGRTVTRLRRLGKRIAIGFDNDVERALATFDQRNMAGDSSHDRWPTALV